MPESDILDTDSNFSMNKKIKKIEYHQYVSYTKSCINNNKIRITVRQTDEYPLPPECFLFIHEKVDLAKVRFCHNGLTFLFELIWLEINGIEVDSARLFDVTSSLKGYLTCTPDNYYY